MHDLDLDELDFQLINALQLDPRASWTKLSSALGVAAATLGRRWKNLSDNGLAWVTAYPSAAQVVTAIAEVTASTGDGLQLATLIGRDPDAFTVDAVSGGRDVIVLAIADSPEQMADYLLERLGPLPGVATVSSNLAADTLVEGSRWNLRALDNQQTAAVRRRELDSRSGKRRDPEFDALVAQVLAEDGRAAVSDIASRLGSNPRRVREAMAELINGQRLILRTEIARPYSAWPVSAYFFITAPPSERTEIALRLSGLKEARSVLRVVGRYDIIAVVWLRSLADASRLETTIAERFPSAKVADRSIVLRTTKLAGNTLSKTGTRTGLVQRKMNLH